MTEEERKDKRREARKRERQTPAYKAARAFYDFKRRVDGGIGKLADWRANNPEKVREMERRRAARRAPKRAEYMKRKDRRRGLARVQDQDALRARIVRRVEAAAPRNIPADVRSGVIAMLVERVYDGTLPAKVTTEHGAAALIDYRREVENFKFETASLDNFVGEDGFTLGHKLGVY